MNKIVQNTYQQPITIDFRTPDVSLQSNPVYEQAGRANLNLSNSIGSAYDSYKGYAKQEAKEAKEAAYLQALADYESKIAALDEAIANGMGPVEAERNRAEINKQFPNLKASDRSGVQKLYTTSERQANLYGKFMEAQQTAEIEQDKEFAKQFEEMFPTVAASMNEADKAWAGRAFEQSKGIAADVLAGRIEPKNLTNDMFYKTLSVLNADLIDQINKADDQYIQAGQITRGKEIKIQSLMQAAPGADYRVVKALIDEEYKPLENAVKAYGEEVKMNKETLSNMLYLKHGEEKAMMEAYAPVLQYHQGLREFFAELAFRKMEAEDTGKYNEKTKTFKINTDKLSEKFSVGSLLTRGGQVQGVNSSTGTITTLVPALTKASFSLGFSMARSASPANDEYTQKVNTDAMQNLNKQNEVLITGKQNPTAEDKAESLKNMSLEDLQNSLKNSSGILNSITKMMDAYENTKDPYVKEGLKKVSIESLQNYLLGATTRLKNDLETGSFIGDKYWLRVKDNKIRVYEQDTSRNIGKIALTEKSGTRWIDVTDSASLFGLGEGPQTVFRAHVAEIEAAANELLRRNIITKDEYGKLLQETLDVVAPQETFNAPSGLEAAGEGAIKISEKIGEVTETAVSAPINALLSAGSVIGTGVAEVINQRFNPLSSGVPEEEAQKIIAKTQKENGVVTHYETPFKKDKELLIGYGTPMSYFETDEGKTAAALLAPEFWERYSKDENDARISKKESLSIEWFRTKKQNERKKQ